MLITVAINPVGDEKSCIGAYQHHGENIFIVSENTEMSYYIPLGLSGKVILEHTFACQIADICILLCWLT